MVWVQMRRIRKHQKKIYAAKGRPSDNPLIVHICKFEELVSIAKEVPAQAEKAGRRILARTAHDDRLEE